MNNFTSGSTFFLMGFTDIREIQILHAVFFLLIYLAALFGNLLIITLITKDHCLHTPMYFFLKNLSFLDLCLISITVPKSIMNSLMNHNSISFFGCVSQVFFFFLLATTEVALLTVMSYDRYVAICLPLRYDVIMSHRSCVEMAASSWLSGGLNAILHTASTFSIPMCGSPEVHQFFCDVPQLLSLTFVLQRKQVQSFLYLLASPPCCDFVSLFRVFCLSTLLAQISITLDLLISVFYTVVPPTMNPLIYSLRNKDMKIALGKLRKARYFQSN
uniref:Olfactory receptor n=1 Tax=Sus scrofa TaxID=9823 RepID=A0A8D1ERV3_PIG